MNREKHSENKLFNQEIKSQIIILENKLRKEKVKYNRNKLMEAIKKLESVYVANDTLDAPAIQPAEKMDGISDKKHMIADENDGCKLVFINEQNAECFSKNVQYSKIFIENIRQNMNLNYNCKELVINSCANLNCTLQVDNSASINHVEDSILRIVAEQLRLSHCKNVKLIVHSKSGVVIEYSRDITIVEWKIEGIGYKNLFSHVTDFSNPLGSANYKIYYEQ